MRLVSFNPTKGTAELSIDSEILGRFQLLPVVKIGDMVKFHKERADQHGDIPASILNQ